MKPLFYIHKTSCISAQESFGELNLDTIHDPVDKKLYAIEPSHEGIPPGVLRRMGKAVRLGVGAAMPIIKDTPQTDGIIIGTANGGMEDCIKFLNQIIQYDEGQLAPGNFVQSTTNAVAAQLGLISKNKGYNITHVHRGLSFENAIIDAGMQLAANRDHHYLLGAVDEISAYNYNIDILGGWYKEEDIRATALYDSGTNGSIAGEGAAMFLVNNDPSNAIAKLEAIQILHSEDENFVEEQLRSFLAKNLAEDEKIDLLISGENGDTRLSKYYAACENVLGDGASIARYKHMSGEYHTATLMGTWLACYVLAQQNVPLHMIKRKGNNTGYKKILHYNNVRGYQHSFILTGSAL